MPAGPRPVARVRQAGARQGVIEVPSDLERFLAAVSQPTAPPHAFTTVDVARAKTMPIGTAKRWMQDALQSGVVVRAGVRVVTDCAGKRHPIPAYVMADKNRA